VSNIGVRPTFEDDQEQVTVETHLLDFDADLYGKELHLVFVSRLRNERRFANQEMLLTRVARDIQRARIILDRDLEKLDG
jgi:riboflavin kinase/FMN adenylyltransferase